MLETEDYEIYKFVAIYTLDINKKKLKYKVCIFTQLHTQLSNIPCSTAINFALMHIWTPYMHPYWFYLFYHHESLLSWVVLLWSSEVHKLNFTLHLRDCYSQEKHAEPLKWAGEMTLLLKPSGQTACFAVFYWTCCMWASYTIIVMSSYGTSSIQYIHCNDWEALNVFL